MSSWEQYIRGQELAEAGFSRVAILSKMYDCDATVEAIKREVYKSTDCGAWVDFPEDSPLRVEVGSIVEGSDAEVPAIAVPYDVDMKEEEFVAAWWKAIAKVEDMAAELWEEANGRGSWNP